MVNGPGIVLPSPFSRETVLFWLYVKYSRNCKWSLTLYFTSWLNLRNLKKKTEKKAESWKEKMLT